MMSWLIGVLITALTLDPLMVPLMALAATHFMQVMKTVFGDKTRLKEIRKRCIIRMLDDRLRLAEEDISAEQLRREVDHVLDLPANAGVIQLSLGVFVLVSSTLQVGQADSVRTGTFPIERSFAEDHHKVTDLPSLMTTHDVVADVFSGTCAILGLALVGERWCKEGQLAAWHLAVKLAGVGQFELDFQALGVAPGVGCFTWRASGGNPAELEAADPAVLLEHNKRLDVEHSNLSIALRELRVSETPDDPELARPSIRAGADVSRALPPLNTASVCNAAEQGNTAGNMECAKWLIEARSNLELKWAGLSRLGKAMRCDHAEFAKLLIEVDADTANTESTVGARDRGGSLHLQGGDTVCGGGVPSLPRVLSPPRAASRRGAALHHGCH